MTKTLQSRQLPQFWYAAGARLSFKRIALIGLLLPLSYLYRALLWLRQKYFQHLAPAAPLPCPVIVVGNIYIGGTGKTPLLISLVSALKNQGWHPGVVTRGYGHTGSASELKKPLELSPHHDARQVGDEALLIYLQCKIPVVVCNHRDVAAKFLLAQRPEVNVILADDGLQHYALYRDIEIALYDGRGIGNGQVLPAGPLRESPHRAVDYHLIHLPRNTAPTVALQTMPTLKTAHIVYGEIGLPYVLPYALSSTLSSTLPEKNLSSRPHSTIVSWQQFGMQHADARLHALAGIGDPERFFNALKAQGLHLSQTIALPDHFAFPDNFFADFNAHDVILLTEKDAVKCFHHVQNCAANCAGKGPQLWVVPYSIALDAQWFDTLNRRLLALVQNKSNAI